MDTQPSSGFKSQRQSEVGNGTAQTIRAGSVEFDVINKAAQYNQHKSGVEAIDVCRHLTGDWFNVFKYVFRAEFKNGRQDIEKAQYYAKDALYHQIPMHLPTWHKRQDELVIQVVRFENDEIRRQFFLTFIHQNGDYALSLIEDMLR